LILKIISIIEYLESIITTFLSFARTMNCIDGICQTVLALPVNDKENNKQDLDITDECNSNLITIYMLCFIIYYFSYKEIKHREEYCGYNWPRVVLLILRQRTTLTRLILALIYMFILIAEYLVKIYTCCTILIVTYNITSTINRQPTVSMPVNYNNTQAPPSMQVQDMHNNDVVINIEQQ
jgi:small-conductance mechanosensitive channel